MTLWGFLSWLFRWPLSEQQGEPICRHKFAAPEPAVDPWQERQAEQAEKIRRQRIESEARSVRIHRGFPPCPGNAYDRRQHRRRILRWKQTLNERYGRFAQ